MSTAASAPAATLVAVTTRPVTMSVVGRGRVVTHIETVPAGTEVYATFRSNGTVAIRVCGSLLSQTVYPSAVTAA
jgi:hypothetical protein